jgi:hypothetical protein
MSESDNAVRRPYRLREWTFILGLPATPAGFGLAKAYGEFCLLPPPLRNFDKYQSSFLNAFDEHIRPLTQLGLQVVAHPAARQYSRILRGTRATILFTHSDSARLEFRDGMVPFRKIIDNIDSRFAGIAEICACAPHGLQDLIKARAPASLVKVSNTTLSSKLWMACYGRFLSEFALEQASFGDACLRTNSLLNEFH